MSDPCVVTVFSGTIAVLIGAAGIGGLIIGLTLKCDRLTHDEGQVLLDELADLCERNAMLWAELQAIRERQAQYESECG